MRVVLFALALLAVATVAVKPAPKGALYPQFLKAVEILRSNQLSDKRFNDVALRTMAFEAEERYHSEVAKIHRPDFAKGIEAMQWEGLSIGPEQIHIAVTDSPTNVSVIWITAMPTSGNATSNSMVCYQQGSSDEVCNPATSWTYDPISVIPWTGLIFGAYMTGLVPGATYTYRVGSVEGWSDNITFTAPNLAKDKVRIAFGGDMGTIQLVGYKVAAQMAAYHATHPLDVFWHLGDIAYSTLDPPKWNFEFFWDMYLRQEQSLASQVPMMMTYGNHDFSGGDSGAFINRFRNPAGGNGNFYWSYTHGPITYISICTEVGLNPAECAYTNGTKQYSWLEAQLASVDRSKTPWVIVGGHRPMYSSDKSTDSGRLQADLEPLLAKYKVDVELAGHMHETELTTPVFNNVPNMTGVVTVNASSFTITNAAAPVHITVGTLGAVISERWVEPEPGWSLFRQGTLFSDSYGFGTIVADRSTLRFEFHSQATGGVMWDATLRK